MPVRYAQGDITMDDANILVNTVNCVGVMGKGVALAFKNKWPSIIDPYKLYCREGKIRPGGCTLFPLPDNTGRHWAALATKDHWRDSSQYEWVKTGVGLLALAAQLVGARSIAIPPPGCGNGGLDWGIVHPMVLKALSEFDLRIYGTSP